MNDFTVEVTGQEMIIDNIRRITEKMNPEVVENILFEQSEMVKDRIITRAPQGPTGNLKRGIVSKVLQRKGDKYAPAFVGINYGIAPHAHLVEFGHIIKRVKGGRGFGVVPPHPFFRPIWDSSSDEVRTNIEQQIKENIEEAPST